MDIEDASALIFQTYYMMDWAKVGQIRSKGTCVSCGGHLMMVEPVRDKKGLEYEGRVCHTCKTLLWVRTR